MRTSRDFLRWISIIALAFVFNGIPLAARGDLSSNQASVQLVAQPFPEEVTVDVSPGLIGFALSAFGMSAGSAPLHLSVNHVLDPQGGTRSATIWLYFATADALASNSGVTITADRVLGQIDTGPISSFSSLTPFGSSTVGLGFPISVEGSGDFGTDVNLFIDGTGLSLPPDPLAGTLFVQVQVI